MSTRDIVLAVIIGVCVLLTGYLLIGKPFSPKYPPVPGAPKGIHVICTSPGCGFEEAEYRASARDPNWPKTCPKCGKDTLYWCGKCPHCGKYTPNAPLDGMQHSVKCIHCGKDVPQGPPDDPSLYRLKPEDLE